MQKICTHDMVKVISGKYRGSVGQVLKIEKICQATGKNSKQVRLMAYVQGVNLVSKCIKRDINKNEEGRIDKREAPIDISNLALYNAVLGKVLKVGFKEVEGKKVRYFKSTGELVERE